MQNDHFLLAAVLGVFYCHECKVWQRAISENRGATFYCDQCGDLILCDECGRPWNAYEHELGDDHRTCVGR